MQLVYSESKTGISNPEVKFCYQSLQLQIWSDSGKFHTPNIFSWAMSNFLAEAKSYNSQVELHVL